MSACVVTRLGQYIIVRENGSFKHNKNKSYHCNSGKHPVYFTVVNVDINTHVHVNEKHSALSLMRRAYEQNYIGASPWMVGRLDVLLGRNDDWNDKHKNKVNFNKLHKYAVE